jgi:adenylylsulfate kinase-like enzyme
VVKKKLGIKLIEPKERKILKNFGYELMLLDGNIPKELFDELDMDEEDVDTNIEEIKKRTRKFDKSTMKTLHSKTSSMHWKK